MKKMFIAISLLFSLMITSANAAEVTVEAKITGLYVAYFNRAADQEGLKYWTDKAAEVAQQGGDVSSVFKTLSKGFATHPTFTSTYAHLSNKEFVEAIYRNALGRDGDAEGIAYWTDLLDGGMIRSDMVATFVELSMVTDLTPENYPSLSTEELAAAQLRQNLITNKVTVALAFTNQLGTLSNVVDSDNPESDPAYLASVRIISGVTEDRSTVSSTLGFLDEIKGSGDPVGEINNAVDIIIPIQIKVGIFIDSKVDGLGYRTTSGLNGKTNGNGEFQYYEGEEIEFFVGKIKLGQISAKSVITPFDLNESIKVAQFLQTIDYDMQPNNGIKITQKEYELANNYDINMSEFDPNSAYDNDMIKIITKDNLNKTTAVVNDYQAIQHAITTYARENLKSYYPNTIDSGLNYKVVSSVDAITSETVKTTFSKYVFGHPDIYTKGKSVLLEDSVIARVYLYLYNTIYFNTVNAQGKIFWNRYQNVEYQHDLLLDGINAAFDAESLITSLSSFKNVNVTDEELIKKLAAVDSIILSDYLEKNSHPVFKKIANELIDGVGVVFDRKDPTAVYKYVLQKSANIAIDLEAAYAMNDIAIEWNSYQVAQKLFETYVYYGFEDYAVTEYLKVKANEVLTASTDFLGFNIVGGEKEWSLFKAKIYFDEMCAAVDAQYESLNKIYKFNNNNYFENFQLLDVEFDGYESISLSRNDDNIINLCFKSTNNAYIDVLDILPVISFGSNDVIEFEQSPIWFNSGESVNQCSTLSISSYDVSIYEENNKFPITIKLYKDSTQNNLIAEATVSINIEESVLDNSGYEPLIVKAEYEIIGNSVLVNTEGTQVGDNYGNLTYQWEQLSGPTVPFQQYENGNIEFSIPEMDVNQQLMSFVFRLVVRSQFGALKEELEKVVTIRNDSIYYLEYQNEMLNDGTLLEKGQTYTKSWRVKNTSNFDLNSISLNVIQNSTELNDNGILPSYISTWKQGEIIEFFTQLSVPNDTTVDLHKMSWKFMVNGQPIPYKNGSREAYLSYELNTKSTVEPQPNPELIPGVPSLSSPSNGSSTTDTTPTLIWNSVSGATYYKLALASIDGNAIYNLIDVTSTNKTTMILAAGKEYRWSVKSCNSSGCSEGSSYHSFTVTPEDVSMVTGLEASDGIYVDKIRVAWAEDSAANSYIIYRCMNTSVDSCSELASVVSTTYDDLTALASSIYFYRVKSIGTSNTSDFSEYDAGSLSADAALPVTNRPNASDGTYYDKIVISWNIISGITDGANYEVYRCEDISTNSCELISRRTNTSYTDESKDGLQIGKNYYYRIRIQGVGNEVGEFSNYDIGYLDSTSLEAEPPVASQGIYGDKVHVSWTTVSGATKYDVYACTPFGTMSYEVRDSSDCYSIAPAGYTDTEVDDVYADPGVKYWYFVRAWKDGKYGEFSNMSNAGYAGLNIPLVPLVSVVNMGNYLSIRPTPSGDHGAKYYEVYRCTTTQIDSCTNIQNVVPYNDVQDNGVNRDTDYYYRAKSVSYSGNISEFGNYTIGRSQ